MQPLRALASMRAARGILMLHHDGSATALLPKPLAAQVAAVTQRKHYRAALGVARDELARLPPDSSEATAARDMIARTSAKYAAHLLERACEPEAAMQQYLQTIGFAAPPSRDSTRTTSLASARPRMPFFTFRHDNRMVSPSCTGHGRLTESAAATLHPTPCHTSSCDMLPARAGSSAE